ncbi:MAG TPA: FHA domain-containing protein [Tetrasphaera sp.]|uniref:FHA domain-containing protein n=1 Tax=Nostocoides sp. TaxID=1917966 RepID=UPI002BBA3866|nr:FHA domain-containing protein [Tetrasphaera sp.]HNQ05737.1 FHA domain-containing protein [Tetrasphaera sp.]
MNIDDFAHYLPGDGVAIVLGARAILLPGSPGDTLSTECLTALAGSGVEAAIDALFARGLRAAPDFAICEIDADGRARALTRGQGRVEVETASDRHVLDDGRLVADHEYTDVVMATLSLAHGSATPAVPVQGGVVPAAAVRLTPMIAAAHRPQPDELEVLPLFPTDDAEPAVEASDPVWALADPAHSPHPPSVAEGPSDDGVAVDAQLMTDAGDGVLGVADASSELAVGVSDSWFSRSEDVEAAATDADVRQRPVDLSKAASHSEDLGEPALDEQSNSSPVDDPLDDAVDLVDAGWGSTQSNADTDADDSDDGFVNAGPSWNPADWRVTPHPSGGTADAVDVFDNQPAFTFPPPPGEQRLLGPDPDGDMELTIARGDLLAALDSPPGACTGPMVLAKKCAQGHFTVAFQPTCRVCHAPVPEQEPVEISRPALGILRLESGEVITVDRDIVLGRSPREIPGHQGERPHLARIVDPQHEVSGQHALISVNYWLVSVTDLGSTNGTEIVDALGVTTRLTSDTPVVIEPGSTIILGEVSRISFEATA